MLAASLCAKAQEITITLYPGWNWISYPNAEAMEIDEAMGDFLPMEGDMIKSQFINSKYSRGRWAGGVTHFMPGWGYMYYSARTEYVEFVFAQPPSDDVVTATPTSITDTSAVVGGMVVLPEGTHVFLRGVCWGTLPSPDIDGDHTSDGTGIGSFSSTIEGLTPATTYYVRAYVVSDHGLAYGNELLFTTGSSGSGGHAYIDLGLPSGALWATCNVGADNPEDYGDYFAWGETQPKDSYSWDNYLYGSGYNQLTKYCYDSYYGYNGFADTLTVLLPEDDAATANWGTDWRMPNNAEWNELFIYTTKTQTTQNGVYGTLFTGENGNSIFLPAAGCWYNESPNDVGQFGYYWSNKLYSSYPSASYYFTCNPDGTYYLNSIYDRFVGRSVRAVRTVPLATYTINATANPEESGWVIGADSYREGAECTLVAEAYEEYIFINWTEDGEVVSTDATYSFIVTGNRNLVANFVINDGTYHEYVDLGLPSGLLWATCNVGASLPEDYGDYFAWGETQPKVNYNWSTYQYCNGSYNTLTKYCTDASYGYNGFTDNLTTLLPEDDAATANWDSDWRMPTKEEWQELYNNTNVIWTTQNGVNGRLFISSNGNSLFLPASGYFWGSELYNAGSNCLYGSSSFRTDFPINAWYFSFDSGNYQMDGSYTRSGGFTVRPVRSSEQNTAPTGAINGKFTINADGDQVYFSQGNLQYKASTDTWKFAESQHDFIGDANSNISSFYDGWIDLFGWGTSGYHDTNDSYNVNYQPWSSSDSLLDNDYNIYGYGPSTNMPDVNLTGTSANYDWGVNNPISNGGNTANQWRTLTQPEWNYVLNTRNTPSGIRFAKAQVNDINGVILLPDDWTTDTYTLNNTNSIGASYISNVINATQWVTIENAGGVFLPAAGGRFGTTVADVGSTGFYWLSSSNSSCCAYYVYIYNSGIYLVNYRRYLGRSVRLVCDVE
jgi:hypothetical protein